MAPIRRYLRISKRSVLECRVYLENPSDSRWLLDPRDPVLPRVFKSIQPLVLPKVREENERARARKKSKPVKDVLVEDDYEVSIFLRQAGTRHSILTRHKTFKNVQGRIASTSNKLTGTTNDSPIYVPDEDQNPRNIRAESDEDVAMNIEDIPEVSDSVSNNEEKDSSTEIPPGTPGRRSTRRQPQRLVASDDVSVDEAVHGQDDTDEKKLGLATEYDAFDIWGWVLCIIIKRRKPNEATRHVPSEPAAPKQVLMEEWICTQAPQEFDNI
ncbi:hypothetical protein FQN57_002056 [Myotisia sp. PD_48]|nr:hypothetical protein FQN57_002056 [Myotisia sp. PD_48]